MPTFRTADGRSYTTDNPSEVTRMRMSRRYAEDNAPAVVDTLFHPADKSVSEVANYIAENPADAPRVIAEEKAGQRRKTIISE